MAKRQINFWEILVATVFLAVIFMGIAYIFGLNR